MVFESLKDGVPVPKRLKILKVTRMLAFVADKKKLPVATGSVMDARLCGQDGAGPVRRLNCF